MVCTRGRVALAFAALMACAACGTAEQEAAPERTERERDSLIARSALPHASGVGAALRAQDRAAAANARIDSIASSVR